VKNCSPCTGRSNLFFGRGIWSGVAATLAAGLLTAGAMAQSVRPTRDGAAVDASIAKGVVAGSMDAKSGSELTSTFAAQQKLLFETPQRGFTQRGSPPLGGGCQTADNAQAFNYTAFQVADNFNAASTGQVTSISWTAAYRNGAGTAPSPFVNGTPPATETFQLRFLNDAGGRPGTVIGAPITLTNPIRINSGAPLGALTVWDYTATFAGGPNVTAGTCYWVELRNTSTLGAGSNVSFWLAAAAPPGDTFSYIAPPAPSCTNGGYTPFDVNIGDLTFCLNVQFNPLDGLNCPLPTVPAPACNNPQGNGHGLTVSGTGIFSMSQGSATVGTGGRFQCAEKFQIGPGGGGNLNSVCFWGFFIAQSPGQRVEPCSKNFDVIIWNSDATTGLPSTVVGQRRANVDAGVTSTRGQDAAFNDIFTVEFAGNPIALSANTCYWLTISHLHTPTNTALQGQFLWGTVPDNAADPLLNNTFAIRTLTAAGVVGAWQNAANIGANANNMSFLLNLGPVVPTTCALPTPPNDTCASAAPLPLTGAVVTGFNANGSSEALPGCAFDLVVGPTVWYTFTGTGNNVTLTTCNAGTNFDTILAVYCAPNGCAGPFNCVGGNDDGAAACGVFATASTVTVPTVASQQYFVVVYGSQIFNDVGQTTATFSSGSFALSATQGAASVAPPTCASLQRCVLDTEVFDFAEVDPCGTGTGIDTNNACLNATLYPALGQVAKGTLSTSGQARDIDLYRLPAAANGQTVSVSIRAESPVIVQILNEATGACGAAFTVVPNTTLFITFCLDLDLLLFEAALPSAGNNYILLTMPNFDGNPCGVAPNSQNDYRLLVGLSPSGACCVDQFTACTVGTIFACADSGGTNFFADTPCVVGAGLDVCTITGGSCCLPDNTCQVVPSVNVPTNTDCAATGGTFTAGLACDPNPCGASTGACCCGSTCSITSAAACVGTNRAFAGNGTACNPVGNNRVPCCKADFNHFLGANNPQVTVQDIFDFVGSWFANDACADITNTGLPLTIQDIFDYLSAFFAAPVGGGC